MVDLSIQNLCLNPKFSLRFQMFLSFGCTASVSITAFVMIALYTILNSGESVRHEASNLLEEAIRYSLGRNAQYVAETMGKRFDIIGGAASIITEATRDRFVGYQSLDGWETDDYVPFQDTLSGFQVYPINADPLPLEWDLTGNINKKNFHEHLPYNTMDWYPDFAKLSSYGAYFMQGACDPEQSDPNHPTYYPDCTDENNNLEVGGKVNPTDTNYHIAEKAKDLIWVLKPLFEAHYDVRTMGIYFANDGAGSNVRYPATTIDARANFTSIGCDWMRIIHPLTNAPVGTEDQIARCNGAGETHTMRRYNPLEQPWCRDQVEREIALFEGRTTRELVNIQAHGPYLDTSAKENLWVMTFGQAVFDRLTNEFIACTLMDVSIELMYESLYHSSVDDSHRTVKSALLLWDEEGSVIVATNWNPKTETTVVKVTDPALELGVDAETYKEMRNLVDYDFVWDPEEVKALYRKEIFENGGRLIMSHPVPSIPDTYDPLYHPVYFIILSIERQEAYGVLEEMEILIVQGVEESRKKILVIGGIGFGIVLVSIAFISGTLAGPLRWMKKVSGKIVDSAGGHDLSMGLPDEEDAKDAEPFCSPRTEVTLLLNEFVKMVNGFRRDGAAEVAGAKINEVKNHFEWKKCFSDLYAWGDDCDIISVGPDGFPKQLSIPSQKTDDTYDDEMTMNTFRSQSSIFSLISSSLPAKYAPMVEHALEKTTTVLASVKEYAVLAGTKAGIIVSPDLERNEGPPRVHLGENIHQAADIMNDYFEGVEDAQNSYLFWWTTFFIGTPIVISAVFITLAVADIQTTNIPVWLADVKDRTIDIELGALITATRIRAAFGHEVMHRFARDLHIYTRAAGWLLLGGLQRADSLTFQATGDEQCKFYDNERKKKYNETCPYDKDDMMTPCLCEWGDPRPDYACKTLNEVLLNTGGNPFNTSSNTTFNRTLARYWQHRWYTASKSDADDRGDRFKSSYPSVDYWPNTTSWWNDTSEMPGAERGSAASGYETTYDRVRVLSALAIADFPLYNYFAGRGEERLTGTFVGFEADGMLTGFSGCNNKVSNVFFQSNDDNKAYEVNSDLCPRGKYGYDSRCRPWYPKGYAEHGFILVSPPQISSASGVIGLTAGAALIDQRTQDHIGETLFEFSPRTFIDAVSPANMAIGQGGGGFPVIITTTPDVTGADTVVGPHFKQGVDTAPIGRFVLPYDAEDSTNRQLFEETVVERMRNASAYYSMFTRTTESGDQEEMYMTYAPVMLRSLRAVDATDFLAGVDTKDLQVYALGFGISVQDLAIAFGEVESKVNHDIEQVSYVALTLVIGAVLMVMYMTYTMTLYLAEPILCLVSIVKSIVDKTLTDELPKLQGGSYEIRGVYDALEKLCKIVRFSSTAYLRANRKKAYKVMGDALELFTKMGNQKALGVANNNIGTLVLQEQMEKSSTTARSEEVFLAGIKYFDEAIRIGTYEYQNAEWDDKRGDFVKQLANRVFNRGMFYVVNRDLCKSTFDAEALGIKDLDRAKSLDQEAYLYCREHGRIVQEAESEFFCLLRRARGMLTLVQMANFKDVWGIDSLIERAADMIQNVAFSDSTLFDGVNLIARKQQVSDLKIQYALSKGDTLEAARIAMQILVEDEYVIDTVLMNCVNTVNSYYESLGVPNQVPYFSEAVKHDTRRAQVDSLRTAKNVIFCLDYSGSMAGARMHRANKNLMWIYEEHCLDKDYVGFCRFNHGVDDRLYFDLQRKGGKQEEHEAILRQALDAEGGTRLYAALNTCVSMALASGNSFDTWIVALTDGISSWDFPAKQVVKRIEQNNKKEGPKIHVIIIGFEVPPEVAESVAIVTQLTDKSLYIDARGGLDEMDSAFEHVASLITGTAITVETF